MDETTLARYFATDIVDRAVNDIAATREEIKRDMAAALNHRTVVDPEFVAAIIGAAVNPDFILSGTSRQRPVATVSGHLNDGAQLIARSPGRVLAPVETNAVFQESTLEAVPSGGRRQT